MKTATGLDVLLQENCARLKGKHIGIVCNQASVSHDYRHILEILLPDHRAGKYEIKAVFGPQHGLFGHTQDNMIEWEGAKDPRTGLNIYSLYGKHREPTAEMLEGVDLLLVDLQDVGSRYYTFVWTMALCMKACAERDIPVIVLDRPNPIGGLQVEGTVLDPEFESFVGLYPIPTRHGMTVAEIATYVKTKDFANLRLEVILMQGWSRSDYHDDTDAPWAMPSPNMPSPSTALVYPGACLLEGTNLSEGRGTTRPFEIFGAPFIDGWKVADALKELELPGVSLRPIEFQPTFQKLAGELCSGCFLHINSRRGFEPITTFVAILQEVRRQAGDQFKWNDPPYEYEHEKLPIDILAGNSWLRPAIDNLSPIQEIRTRFLRECAEFEPLRKECLLYPTTA